MARAKTESNRHGLVTPVRRVRPRPIHTRIHHIVVSAMIPDKNLIRREAHYYFLFSAPRPTSNRDMSQRMIVLSAPPDARTFSPGKNSIAPTRPR